MQFIISNNNFDMLMSLKQKGVDINQPMVMPQPSAGGLAFDFNFKAPPIFYATMYAKPKIVAHYIKNGAVIHQTIDNLGFTDSTAVRFSRHGTLTILAAFGTSPTYQKNLNLKYEICAKNVGEIAEILIDNKLDFNKQYALSKYPLDQLFCRSTDENFIKIIKPIVLKGGLDLVAAIERDYSKDASFIDTYINALHESMKKDIAAMRTIELPCAVDQNRESNSSLKTFAQNPTFDPNLLGEISNFVVGDGRPKRNK